MKKRVAGPERRSFCNPVRIKGGFRPLVNWRSSRQTTEGKLNDKTQNPVSRVPQDSEAS